MATNILYQLCDTCKIRIDKDYFSSHNCTYEKKFRDVEENLQLALEENLRLKAQNEELLNSITGIRKQITDSFAQVKAVVENLQKKVDEKK